MARYVMRLNIPRWVMSWDRREQMLGFVLNFLKENRAHNFIVKPYWSDNFVYTWEIKFKVRPHVSTKYVLKNIQDAIDSDRKWDYNNGLGLCTLSKR